MNTRNIGSFYEGAACEYLEQQGLTLLERNFRCKQGEIDIIARDGDCTVFVEVKYRRSKKCGEALRAVGYSKQKKICKCAALYCMLHPETAAIRYDVIGITDTKIEWVKNAFVHIGYAWQ